MLSPVRLGVWGLRRTLGFVAMALGLILIFLAPLARFYVTPRIKKLPTDFYFREVATGMGTYLNPQAGLTVVGPVPVRNVTIQRGDVHASTKTVAVWDQFSSLSDTQNDHSITYDVQRLTLDRHTSASVNCCGESQKRGSSLTAFFPIGTEKKTYQFFDFNADRAFPISYVGTTTIDGLSVYRFHQRIAPLKLKSIKLLGTQVGLTDPNLVDLDWMYSSDTDIWVEPVTGAPVKALQKADQWFADSTGTRRLTVAQVQAQWDDPTVRKSVHDASDSKSQLQLIQFSIPVFGGLAGIVLLVVGLLLLSRAPSATEHAATSPDDTPEP
jgi:hypothetical protein